MSERLPWHGNYRFMRVLRARFPESADILDDCRHTVGVLPHNVFGICWVPWIREQLSSRPDEDLMARLVTLLDEIATEHDEYWAGVLWLSIFGPLQSDAALWTQIRARTAAATAAEMDEYEDSRLLWSERNRRDQGSAAASDK